MKNIIIIANKQKTDEKLRCFSNLSRETDYAYAHSFALVAIGLL
jgi:hypothetical protein